MSGHSKWATIRRKKEKVDAARGKVFTKIIRELQIAARMGGSDIDGNPRLRSAVDTAKAANMPAATMERAIKKGAGEQDGVMLEEVIYEGYGPGGAAVMVECVTDNRNRTVSEVRHAFTKRNGSLAESGAVAWMFERLGRLTLEGQGTEDEIMEIALDSGATDVTGDETVWEVLTDPSELYKVKAEIEKRGKQVSSAEIAYVAKTTVKIEETSQAKSLLGLVEALEDLDDTQQVHFNFEMDDSLMESLA